MKDAGGDYFADSASANTVLPFPNLPVGGNFGHMWYVAYAAVWLLSVWAPSCATVLNGQSRAESLRFLVAHPVSDDVTKVYEEMEEAIASEDATVLLRCIAFLHFLSSSPDGLWAIRRSGGIDLIERAGKVSSDAALARQVERALYTLKDE